MSNIVTLTIGDQQIKVEAGELISYKVKGHEFMHQKGNPGWRSVDTEMFPLIGPTNEADFKVKTPRGFATQDQHGLLREMKYALVHQTENILVFNKKYTANEEILNSKFPNKSTAEKLSWPYDFTFEKTFKLENEQVSVEFKITGEEGMPFMLGYHPAFMLHTGHAIISAGGQNISIPEVMEVGSRALQLPNIAVVLLKDKRTLEIKSEGFSHFMLWTEVPNMVCIEPITFYPYAVAQHNLEEGFMFLKKEPMNFKVVLKPL
jgi:galactose mutarotase-like enzyme